MKKPAMRIFLCVQVLLIILSVSTATCRADEILFLNGDRLTGKMLNMRNETVTFKPELMGRITFDISKVESLTTDEPVKINFDDGTSITTKTISFEEGKVLITGVNTGGVLNVPPDEVFSAGKPGAGRKANWSGSISGGFTKTDNDEETTTLNALLQLQRRSPKHRLRMRGILFIEEEDDSETSKRETTEENFNSDVRYDYFFKKKWFWANGINYKRDIINDLDYRVLIGSGLGYQILDTTNNEFDITTGLAYTKEQYTDEDNSYLSYLFGINFNLKLWDSVTANLDAALTPKIDEPSDYIARGFGGLKLNATDKFFINFNTIFEYNSRVKTADSTETKFILGFGWDFL
jgi:hypothetical protein